MLTMRDIIMGFFVALAAFINGWTGISILPLYIVPMAQEVSRIAVSSATTTPTAATFDSEVSPPKIRSSESKKQTRKEATPTLPLPSLIAPIAPLPPLPAPVGNHASATALNATASSSPAPAPVAPPKPVLPPLDLDAIFSSVVKIECPSEDRKGKYVGSGFVLSDSQTSGISIVTVAHLLMASGTDSCTVIFPKDRAPSRYFTGAIREDRALIRKRHDEEGIDIAIITLPPLAEYPEAKEVFPDAYPAVPYPICTDPDMIGDVLYHFGYPSNFLNQSYLSKSDGKAVAYADIKGIETVLSQDQTSSYKSPIFSYVTDTFNLHPYMASQVATFYGDSGGLAFNATKQCILGPQRGGTIGGGAGENISIFPLLGWPPTRPLLP